MFLYILRWLLTLGGALGRLTLAKVKNGSLLFHQNWGLWSFLNIRALGNASVNFQKKIRSWRSPINCMTWGISLSKSAIDFIGLRQLQLLFSLFSMTHLGNAKNLVLSRCRVLVNVTNSLKWSYYRGNIET
jgi:hypothetical protein